MSAQRAYNVLHSLLLLVIRIRSKLPRAVRIAYAVYAGRPAKRDSTVEDLYTTARMNVARTDVTAPVALLGWYIVLKYTH